MRTLLAAVLLAALIVAGVAIVVPLIARPIIVAAIQSASPFGDQPLEIEVDCNVFGLLTGTVDRIHVRGTALTRGDVTIGALDATLVDAATSGHAFRMASGRLASILVPTDDASAITFDDVQLDGPSSALFAVATLDAAAAARLIESALAEAGVQLTGIELGTGTVAFQVFGTRAEVPLGVEFGSIVLVDPFGTGSLPILTPGPDDGWQLTGVGVTPAGLTINATVDVERLLASS